MREKIERRDRERENQKRKREYRRERVNQVREREKQERERALERGCWPLSTHAQKARRPPGHTWLPATGGALAQGWLPATQEGERVL